MTFDRKPKIFEDVDDALFQELPPNYRLLESGDGFEMAVDFCERHGAYIALCPFHRPIARCLTYPGKKESS